MNEISRLKVESEELHRSVNFLKEKVGKVKYHKVENYYVCANRKLYAYEGKGDSLAFTSGKVDGVDTKISVSLYIDDVFVDKRETSSDGTFSFTYLLPQSKGSEVKILSSTENAVLKSARTFVIGNVAIAFNQTAKLFPTDNGVCYGRVKNGELYISTNGSELKKVKECEFYDIVKVDQDQVKIVAIDENSIVLNTITEESVNSIILKVFKDGEENYVKDLCATIYNGSLIVVAIIGKSLKYYCFDLSSVSLLEDGDIKVLFTPYSVCFVKNATKPILIANASDKNYTMQWIE